MNHWCLNVQQKIKTFTKTSNTSQDGVTSMRLILSLETTKGAYKIYETGFFKTLDSRQWVMMMHEKQETSKQPLHLSQFTTWIEFLGSISWVEKTRQSEQWGNRIRSPVRPRQLNLQSRIRDRRELHRDWRTPGIFSRQVHLKSCNYTPYVQGAREKIDHARIQKRFYKSIICYIYIFLN